MATSSVLLDFHQQKLRNVEISPAHRARPEDTLTDVIRMMCDKRCGCAVVCDDNGVCGTFSERIVCNKILPANVDLNEPVKNHLNPDAPVLKPDDTIGDAVRHMHATGIRHLPVWNDDERRLVGVLSVRDVIHLVAQYYPEEIYNLPPRIRQQMDSPEGA
jgi:predicted transcriptional regulator